MARQESDREDLLREATALVERVELRVAGTAEPIVVGFRKDGAASVYFGASPVLQFNAAGELRRAFVDGRLLKAERGRLVALTRHRTAGEVALVREALTAAEHEELLAAAQLRLAALLAALEASAFEIVGVVPEQVDVALRVRRWLADRPSEMTVAARPNVR